MEHKFKVADTREYLSRREASEYLLNAHGVRIKPDTLAKMASVGGGPRYKRDGRMAVYFTPDLDAWAETRSTPFVNTAKELPPISKQTQHAA